MKLSGVSPLLLLFTFMNVENNSTLAISELQMRACPPLSGIPEAKDLVPCVCVGGWVGGWGGGLGREGEEMFCGSHFHDLIQLFRI